MSFNLALVSVVTAEYSMQNDIGVLLRLSRDQHDVRFIRLECGDGRGDGRENGSSSRWCVGVT